jgi:spoIIIJ-associated protein
MKPAETARDILQNLIHHLGYEAQLDLEEAPAGPVIQVTMEHAEALIGSKAERLEDLQYLVNRLLQVKQPDAPKIRVDVAHVREMKEDELLEEVQAAANRVRASHKPALLRPLNSFHRRLVHNLFLNDPQVRSISPEDRGRFKRITLAPR